MVGQDSDYAIVVNDGVTFIFLARMDDGVLDDFEDEDLSCFSDLHTL